MNLDPKSPTYPLALLLNMATGSISEALDPMLGKQANKNSAPANTISCETIAAQIVAFSIASYGNYRVRNALDNNAQTRQGFLQVIWGALETGYTAAEDVLQKLGMLDASVAADIHTTRVLILLGLDAFAADAQTQPGGPMPAPGPV